MEQSKKRFCGRRRRTQRGSEIMEFALLSILLVPTFLMMFVTGMNLIRSIKATHIARDLGHMYIQGADFSLYGTQRIAQRLAVGMGLDIGAAFTGNNWNNSSNGGRGTVILSQITYVGDATCAPILAAGEVCTNYQRYVFSQRIVFGKGSLRSSNFGTPSATISTRGIVQNRETDAGAQVQNFAGVFPTTLGDGQFAYLAEVYFGSPDLTVSALSGNGVYARAFY